MAKIEEFAKGGCKGRNVGCEAEETKGAEKKK